MPLHSQFAANRVEITARTFASSLRVSEFRLEADIALSGKRRSRRAIRGRMSLRRGSSGCP